MPKYIVNAAHPETGAEVELPVDAMTPEMAQAFVNSLGLLAGSARPQGPEDSTQGMTVQVNAPIEAVEGAENLSDEEAQLLAERDRQIAEDPRDRRGDVILAGGSLLLILTPIMAVTILWFFSEKSAPTAASDVLVFVCACIVYLAVWWGVVRWWQRSCVPCPRCGKHRLRFLDTSLVRQMASTQLVNQTEYVRSEIRRFGNIGFPDYVVTTPTERAVVQKVVRRLERDRFQCRHCGEICPRLVVRNN